MGRDILLTFKYKYLTPNETMIVTLFSQQLFYKILNKIVVLGTKQKSITLAIHINLMVVTNMSYLTLEYSGSYVAFLTKILICFRYIFK